MERKRMGTGGGVGDGPIPHEAAPSPAGAADSIIASSPAPSWNKRVLRTSHRPREPWNFDTRDLKETKALFKALVSADRNQEGWKWSVR
jgi:hypothetical protein